MEIKLNGVCRRWCELRIEPLLSSSLSSSFSSSLKFLNNKRLNKLSARQGGRFAANIRPIGVCWLLLPLALLIFAGCETTNPSSERVKLSITSSEWVIEEEMLAHTPLGTEGGEVLDFVNSRLVHSQRENPDLDDIYVYIDDQGDSPYPEELKYQVIQVHMGLHGAGRENFLMNSNWVYISWLLENDLLIDIVVTKVIPASFPAEPEPQAENL